MKRKILIINILAIILFAFAAEQKINADKSGVSFMIGNMAVNSIPGTFGGMKGKVIFDNKNLKNSSFNVCIDATTINTENEKRDKHLKTKDFFDVEKFPTICFSSNSISKTSDGYLAKGILNMHGVSKNIEIPFTFKGKIFAGKIKLNRLDYKIGEATNTFMVSDEVDISIVCEVK